MPWLGHVYALAGASGPSLIFFSLVSIGIGGRNGSVGQTIQCACVDCGLDTFAADEWFMLRNEVWEQVWERRRAPWHRKVPGAEIRQPGAPEVSGHSLHQGERLDESSSAAAAITSSSWWSVERTGWSHRVVRFEIGHHKQCTLARQPLLGAREILVLGFVILERRMVLK